LHFAVNFPSIQASLPSPNFSSPSSISEGGRKAKIIIWWSRGCLHHHHTQHFARSESSVSEEGGIKRKFRIFFIYFIQGFNRDNKFRGV